MSRSRNTCVNDFHYPPLYLLIPSIHPTHHSHPSQPVGFFNPFLLLALRAKTLMTFSVESANYFIGVIIFTYSYKGLIKESYRCRILVGLKM